YGEYLAFSTDNGSTFSSPAQVVGNLTPLSDYGYLEGPVWWNGEYATMLSYSGNVFLAFSTQRCVAWNITGYCDYPWSGGGTGQSQVVVSQLYEGPGLTITFNETGLPATPGLRWSVDVQG